MADLQGLYTQLSTEYKKDTDQDFPINKIRFFMDFMWNTVVKKPLTDDQKAHLKQLIDLLNSLDDHKLSPMREMIQAMTPLLSPLLEPYPSLGHTCTVVFTNTIPAYQKYLTSLESQVKDAHKFTAEEILLYYEMTLVDHLIISHVFELETNLNLIEVIETIKTVIIMNALTHDYLQDALGRSISMFTFLQRGGITKEEVFPMYQELVNSLVAKTKENVSNPDCIAYVDFMSQTLMNLATSAQQSNQPMEGEVMTAPQATDTNPQIPQDPQVMPTAPAPAPTPVAVVSSQPVSVPQSPAEAQAPVSQPVAVPQTSVPQAETGISEQPVLQTSPVAQTPVAPVATAEPVQTQSVATPQTPAPQPATPVVPVTAVASQSAPVTPVPGEQKLNGVDDILASLNQQ